MKWTKANTGNSDVGFCPAVPGDGRAYVRGFVREGLLRGGLIPGGNRFSKLMWVYWTSCAEAEGTHNTLMPQLAVLTFRCLHGQASPYLTEGLRTAHVDSCLQSDSLSVSQSVSQSINQSVNNWRCPFITMMRNNRCTNKQNCQRASGSGALHVAPHRRKNIYINNISIADRYRISQVLTFPTEPFFAGNVMKEKKLYSLSEWIHCMADWQLYC